MPYEKPQEQTYKFKTPDQVKLFMDRLEEARNQDFDWDVTKSGTTSVKVVSTTPQEAMMAARIFANVVRPPKQVDTSGPKETRVFKFENGTTRKNFIDLIVRYVRAAKIVSQAGLQVELEYPKVDSRTVLQLWDEASDVKSYS